MARNGSGTYSLPSGNPVVTGTVIASTWANNTLTDIATALTDSLSRSGDGGMLTALKGLAGTAANPGYAFGTDTTTGMYLPASNQLGFSTNGVQRINVTGAGVITAGPSLTAFAIDTAGASVFGSNSANAATRLGVRGNVLAESGGNTIALGLNPVVPNTVANQATMSYSAPNMPATSYTLPSLIHYHAVGLINVGSGSAANIQRGFLAGDAIGTTSAANGYGFDGALVANAAQNWNFYTSGTAPSYLKDLRVGASDQRNSAPLTATAGGTDNAASFYITGNNSVTRNVVWFGTTTNGNSGSITLNGVTVALASVSDYRRKENVSPLAGSVDRLSALKPVEFDWKGMNLPRHRGFLAHEFASVYPQAVSGDKDGVDADGNPVYQMMSESAVITDLVAAVQTLLARVAILESQLSANS